MKLAPRCISIATALAYYWTSPGNAALAVIVGAQTQDFSKYSGPVAYISSC